MIKEIQTHMISVSFQGPVGHCRWRMAGSLLGQPQPCPAEGSGSPAHSMGSRQPAKAWRKSTPFQAAMLQRKAWLRKSSIPYFSFLSYGKKVWSYLQQKFSSDCVSQTSHTYLVMFEACDRWVLNLCMRNKIAVKWKHTRDQSLSRLCWNAKRHYSLTAPREIFFKGNINSPSEKQIDHGWKQVGEAICPQPEDTLIWGKQE